MTKRIKPTGRVVIQNCHFEHKPTEAVLEIAAALRINAEALLKLCDRLGCAPMIVVEEPWP